MTKSLIPEAIYEIDNIMRDNWLALLEELQINGEKGPMNLYEWWKSEQFLIMQSITELKTL